MNEHRYILEKYKGSNSRYDCPQCGKHKVFTRYIDTETGEQIHSTVGRCNREINCGFHYTPKQFFKDKGGYPEHSARTREGKNPNFSEQYARTRARAEKSTSPQPKPKPISYISVEIFEASLKTYNENNFVQFLCGLFGTEITTGLVEKYFIGTSKFWNRATVFWQIDIFGKVRTGKVILYNSSTGKRIKEPYRHINWVHSALKMPEFELKQCFFGEHLLKDKTKAVAIVESEKTAVIASVYLPQFIWLAVGGFSNLNAEICEILKGRNVILYPDLNGFAKWSNKATELSHIATFNISNLLESRATEAEKKQGLDVADYLIKFDIKEFTLEKQVSTEKPLFVNHIAEVKQVSPTHLISSETRDKRAIKDTKTAYVNEKGELYIETPFADTYTIYPSVKNYNKRNCKPVLEKRENINITGFKEVIIDLNTLTIN